MSMREDLGAVVATLEAAKSIVVGPEINWTEADVAAIASRLDLAIEELQALRGDEEEEEREDDTQGWRQLEHAQDRMSAWQEWVTTMLKGGDLGPEAIKARACSLLAELDTLFPAPGGGA